MTVKKCKLKKKHHVVKCILTFSGQETARKVRGRLIKGGKKVAKGKAKAKHQRARLLLRARHKHKISKGPYVLSLSVTYADGTSASGPLQVQVR